MTLATLTRVRLVASAPLLALAFAACGGDKEAPPVPTAFVKTSGDQVSAGVASATPTAPTVVVNDQNGRPMRGIVVNFAITGGGSVGATVDTTDGGGVATTQRWTLGSMAGPQTVVASSPSMAGTTATFTATAAAGAPARLTFVTQPPVSGRAGESFQGPVVEIQDSFGNRTNATATVTLELAGPNGPAQLAGTRSLAAVAGRATFGTLATTTAGALVFLASAPGLAQGEANAMTVAPGPAAALVKLSGDVQLGAAGKAAFLPPSLRVTDSFGNPLTGEPVMFSVTSGGGLLTGGAATTDSRGIATLTRWDLGPNAGQNTVRATIGTATADFAATALAPAPYHMVLRYVNVPTRRQQDAFERAWVRWRQVIRSELTDADFAVEPISNPCFNLVQTVLNEQVDDLLIYVNLGAIDGPGAVLGSAGPCLVRGTTTAPGQTAVGVMRFDTSDLPSLEASGQLDQVILHEMGHVLGIGTIWGFHGLANGVASDSSSFAGANARAVWESLGGAAGTRVPVENCVGISGCGQGTRDGHWREFTFRTELMTGYLNGGVANPLSALTIASLRDIGYAVDASVAESYVLPTNLMAGALSGGAAGATGGTGTSLRMIDAPLGFQPRVILPNARTVMSVEEWKRTYGRQQVQAQ